MDIQRSQVRQASWCGLPRHVVVCLALVVGLAGSVLTVTPPAEATAAAPGALTRIAGTTPTDESVGVSVSAFPAGAPVIYVAATGATADALSASSLRGGPLLLVSSGGALPTALIDEIHRLGARGAVILGGTAAVGGEVEAQLGALGLAVRRLAGEARRETSADIAQSAWSTGARRVYLARDDVAVDALAAGSISDGPLVLVNRDGLGSAGVSATINTIDPVEVVVLGGVDAIPDSVARAVAGARGLRRLAGVDRFATAAAVVDDVVAGRPATVYVATSDQPAEALLPSTADAPVLLVPSCGPLPTPISRTLERLRPASVVVVGGREAVCDTMASAVASAAGVVVDDPVASVLDAPYRVGGSKWPIRDITWSLERSTSDLPVDIVERELQRAFDTWSGVTLLRFRRISGDANIKIGFFDGRDPWGRTFSDDILGWGSLGADSDRHAYLSLNDAFTWTTASLTGRQQPVWAVATHEIGHALAIAHPCESTEVGCESYRGTLPARYHEQVMWWQLIKPLQVLSADDADAARSLYGATPTPTPTPAPTPAPPSTSLGVSFSENPFVCDGGLRPFGKVTGAVSGEVVTFSSPQVAGLLPGTASASGEVSMRWQCDPGESNGQWVLTARGASSGRTTTFTVVGRAPSAPPTPPAPAPAPPAPAPPAPAPAPAPGRSVNLSKGAPYRASWCTHSSCGFMQVNVSGFAPNTAFSYTCFASDGAFFTTTIRTDGAGNGSSAVCVYGFPGRPVWVVVDGAQSNVLTWA